MKLFGLIGFPISHSFSKSYFSEKFLREGIVGCRYELFPLPEIENLKNLLAENPDLAGLNVTLPHKQSVIRFLDDLDETAEAVGAVNCIKIRGRKLTGFNTDAAGFEQSLKNWLLNFYPNLEAFQREKNKAVVLGTGGASKAVTYVLEKWGIPFRLVSRKPKNENEIDYETLNALNFNELRMVFNTTPLGMPPREDACPDLPFDKLTTEHFVYDLIYNPSETLLLRQALLRGARTKNGLEMLHLQAEKAWEIWSQ